MTKYKHLEDEFGIISMSKVISSDMSFDEKEEIVKNYPLSLFETLSKGSGKAHLSKMANFATAHNNSKILNAVLKNDIDLLNDELARFVSSNFVSNGLTACIDASSFRAAINQKRKSYLERIDEQKEQLKRQEWFEKEKKRIENLSLNFDKKFFTDLEKQFDTVDYSFEYAVIKLTSKLESMLKIKLSTNDEEQDLEALINRFYSNPYHLSSLHKLRITRNNYLHPRKEELDFDRNQFAECLEIIFKE